MESQAKPEDRSGKQKFILLALLVVALATVFLLPQIVTGPWIDGGLEERPEPDRSATAVAPSTAAEKTRYRQESQSVLAQIIIVRDRLREQNVEAWGQAEFDQAMKGIATGDEQYSYGDYGDSLASYRQSLDTLNQLEEQGREALDNAVTEAAAAIESLNINVARRAVEVAAQIAPRRSDVVELQSRTEKLPELQSMLEQGDVARASGRLQEAQQAYRAAAMLDPSHQRAAQSVAAIATEMVNSEFRGHMSRAFSALDRGDFNAARGAFDAAEEVSPGDPAIAQGRAQIASREAQQTVNQKMQLAEQYEREEAWGEALAVYQELLRTDESLTAARARLVPVRVRAELDSRFEEFFEDPVSLATRTRYEAAQKTLTDARTIPSPGDKLKGQMVELEKLMARSVTPVDVVFESDSMTHVTLFKIAELGTFAQTSMTLRPGRYIAAGTRQGYRDVRVEFTV
ncbi:MAG: hypothetical protein HKO64_04360, partial [Xanthomonadales bacterium]|nr:hypothetical protein [Xanthomonadales bacterium]